ncbi:MAG: SseB family protein [Clostridiales bacterium]|nr:SseB family protein [Clostridiales bacterium]
MENGTRPPMPEGKRQLLAGLSRAESLFYILISACTREPYVQCDDETYDDEVLLFFTEDAAKEKAKEFAAQKIPVTPMKMTSRQMLLFFTTLYTMGVNAIRIHYAGGEESVQVDEIVKKRDRKEMPDGSVWVENPQLHLTAVYFAQELRRPAGQGSRERLTELQEEMAADFKRGRFIFALQKEGKGTPMIKMKNGEKYQPIFTDILEFKRFCKDDAFRPVVVDANQLPKVLDKEAKGVILNILGVNLPLMVSRPQAQAAQKDAETAGQADSRSAVEMVNAAIAEASARESREANAALEAANAAAERALAAHGAEGAEESKEEQ